MTLEMSPDSWQEWAGALTAVGGTALAAWKRGGAIYGWCRTRLAEREKRTREQEETRKTLRVLLETIELHERRKEADAEIIASLRRMMVDQNTLIERKDRRIAHLETLHDGPHG